MIHKWANKSIVLLGVLPWLLLACADGVDSGIPDNPGNNQKPPALEIPQDVSAIAGTQSVNLTWTDSAQATGYTVYWQIDKPVTDKTTALAEQVQTAQFAHQDLTAGATYHYRVAARKDADESGLSNNVQATALPYPAATPTMVSTQAGDTVVIISWDAVPGADSYKIYWDTADTMENADTNDPIAVIAPIVSHPHGERSNGQTYYYQVSAINLAGESARSSVVSATPQATSTENNDPIITQGSNLNESVDRNGTLTITLNAADIDGDALSWSISDIPSHGTAQTDAAGEQVQVVYYPAENYDGLDSFEVMVDDNRGGTDRILFSVTVNVANAQPQFTINTTQTVDENTTAVVRVAAQDQDANPLTYSLSGGVDQALFSISNPDGDLRFNNAPNFEIPTSASGVNQYQVEVRVNDNSGASNATNTILLSIFVNNINEAPTVANPISDQSTWEGVLFDFAFNSKTFVDVDSNTTLSYRARLTDGSDLPNWLIFDGPTRHFSGSPDTIDVGELPIEVTADDGSGGTVSTRFTISIQALPFGLAIDDLIISEAAGSATLTVTLSPSSTTPVSVNFSTQDDSTVAGQDYLGQSGTLTFNAGEISKQISIEIIDDTAQESTEHFNVVLTGNFGAQITDGEAIVGITDNDPQPQVSFATTSTKVVEIAGNTSVIVGLSNVSEISDIVVPYTITDGSASADLDYQHTGTQLMIPRGNQVGSIRFSILTDNNNESRETVYLSLGTPVNAGVGPIVNHVLEIFDASPTNDTGMTSCSNYDTNDLTCSDLGDGTGIGLGGGTTTHPGQDAEHGRDRLAAEGLLIKQGAGHAGFDFTKLDANGIPLTNQTADYANEPWSCVRDNTTGLIWEVKTTDNGLRHNNNNYTWYNSSGFNSANNPGVANGGSCTDIGNCDTEKYTAAVNTIGLCGYASGWRLPSVTELRSIVKHQASPDTTHKLDIAYFPNRPNGLSLPYWSATPSAGNNEYIWLTDFASGHSGAGMPRSVGLLVRLVRDID